MGAPAGTEFNFLGGGYTGMWQLLGIPREIVKYFDFSMFFHAEGPSGVAVDPLQARSIPVPEKENVRTVLRTVTLSSKEGNPKSQNPHPSSPKPNY